MADKNKRRIFVFKQRTEQSHVRPMLYAFPEDEIVSIKSQLGSHNVYLVINGIEVQGSFDDFVNILGERVNID